ncbi:MAG: type II toxin-antitoxin system PemK/MazF family toxin [Vulcanimicrobiaceae bacterium]
MTAGQIVMVDWRDALPGSGEPNKQRPAVVVGSPRYFRGGIPFEIVVPLTGEDALALVGASLRILPAPGNGCTKPCYALAWNVQTVPHRRIAETASHVTREELAGIRAQVVACVEATST